MGADTAEDAYAIAKRFVYKRMGIAMMKGLAALRFHRLNQAVADSDTSRAAAARRRWAQSAWIDDNAAYYDRHSYGGRTHPRW